MERWIQGSGSGSTFTKCGSQDPDPHQNEMDPKRWLIFKHLGTTFTYLEVSDWVVVVVLVEAAQGVQPKQSKLKAHTLLNSAQFF